jgi:hypothetical protein
VELLIIVVLFRMPGGISHSSVILCELLLVYKDQINRTAESRLNENVPFLFGIPLVMVRLFPIFYPHAVLVLGFE